MGSPQYSRFGEYQGNIDLAKRPVVHNADGSISTELSFSFSPDRNTEILIPRVVNGKVLPEDNKLAIQHFFDTGEHLGAFRNDEPGFTYSKLSKYANDIHLNQEKRYTSKD